MPPKKFVPAEKPVSAPVPAAAGAKALTPAAKPKAADPVVSIPASAVIEKSEVKGSGRAVKAAAPREFSYQDIATRAFEIYAGRGYAAGDPQADWYEAERQLRAGL